MVVVLLIVSAIFWFAKQHPSSAQAPSDPKFRPISQEPGSDQIRHETVSTQETHGSLSDERVQELFVFAAHQNYNSVVRIDSADLLTQKPNVKSVRVALIYALRYDSNPGVRLKSLEGLGPYVKDDVRVRDAVLSALLTDSNPGVRTQAMHLIESVKADSRVRSILTRLAENDQNQYIRSQARNVLAQLTDIQ
jgi:hypothetical protein